MLWSPNLEVLRLFGQRIGDIDFFSNKYFQTLKKTLTPESGSNIFTLGGFGPKMLCRK
jgi:hypothetical protein